MQLSGSSLSRSSQLAWCVMAESIRFEPAAGRRTPVADVSAEFLVLSVVRYDCCGISSYVVPSMLSAAMLLLTIVLHDTHTHTRTKSQLP